LIIDVNNLIIRLGLIEVFCLTFSLKDSYWSERMDWLMVQFNKWF